MTETAQNLVDATKAAKKRIAKEEAEARAETRRKAAAERAAKRKRIKEIVDAMLATCLDHADEAAVWEYESSELAELTDQYKFRDKIVKAIRKAGLWATYNVVSRTNTTYGSYWNGYTYVRYATGSTTTYHVVFTIKWDKDSLKDPLLGEVREEVSEV